MNAVLSLSLLALTAGLGAQDCQKSKSSCQKTSLTSPATKQDCQSKAKACPSTSLTSAKQDCSSQKTSLTSHDTESRFAKKLAALSDADKKIVGKALADLGECPVGSRMPASFAALGKLYSEAIASLDKIASHPKADANLAKSLKAEIAVIAKVAELNTASIDMMKSFASSLGGCCDSAKAECCETAKASKTECCETAKTSSKATCNVTVAADLTKDWGNAMGDYKALSAEKKEKLAKAFMVLKEKGFDMATVMMRGLKKQHELLGKAIGGMQCPTGGVFAKNAKALEACETSRTSCEAASKRLIAAQKLLTAMPGIVESKKETSKTGPAECESSKAKACPSTVKTKTKTEINN